MLPAYGTPLSQWYDGFKEQVQQDPHVMHVTAVMDVLGAKYQTGSFIPEGALETNMQQIPLMMVWYDFIETFDMEISAGRSFSLDFPTDMQEGVILNESSAKRFGWTPEEALGKSLRQQQGQVIKVVGVVKDFNYTSLAFPITPFVLEMPRGRSQMNGWLRYVAIKISAADPQQSIAMTQNQLGEGSPQPVFFIFFP